MQPHPAKLFVAILAAVVVSSSSYADWTASGQFSYTNRLYSASAWTGSNVLPVREADVEVFDLTTQAVLATGRTDRTGAFSIPVIDSSIRNVAVRVLSSSKQTADLDIQVVDDLNGNAVYTYHDASTDQTGHAPTVNVAFGSMTMPLAVGPVASTDWSSQVFNSFDMCLLVLDWIDHVDGVRPTTLLTIAWNPTSGADSSFYGGGTLNRVSLSDDDGYDDANILHEIGHWLEIKFGRYSSIGGSHSSGQPAQDLRLAWGEGFGTFVSGAVLSFHGLPFPNLYSDRDSFSTGSAFEFSLDHEGDTGYGGATSEDAVTAALYDLVDGPASADGTAGDDDSLSGLDIKVWTVLKEMRTRNLPVSTLEEFWDLWRELNLGDEAAIQTAFAAHSADFKIDASEPDDLRSQASTLTGSYVEHTFYRSGSQPGGDEDWYQFTATAGTFYRVEISSDMAGRPDPELYLLGTDGKTVLAHNDDPLDTTLNASTSGYSHAETAPEILWRAPTSGTYYVYCRHASFSRSLGSRYGTYKIRLTTAASPTPTITAVALQTMLPGQSYHALITGDEMATSTTVTTSSPQITVSDIQWIAPSAMVATLSVAPGATAGSFSLTVTNPSAGSDTEANAVTVSSAAQPPILITEVSLDAHFVELKNIGTVAAQLSGWKLTGRTTSTSTTSRVYTFPTFSLAPGATVRVSDGSGTDSATALFDQTASLDWEWSTDSNGDINLVDNTGGSVDYLRWMQSYTRTQLAPLGTKSGWAQPELGVPASGLTISRDETAARARTTLSLSGASPSSTTSAAGRRNLVDAFEDNDTIRRAPILSHPAIVPNLEISSRASGPADVDWFAVALYAGDSLAVRADFNHGTGNLDLEAYAPGNESTPLVASSTTTNTELITISSAMTTANSSGLYRFRVFGNGGATNPYTLTLGTPPPAALAVSTADAQTFTAFSGSSSVPVCHVYTLTNNSPSAISWSLASTAPWLTVSATSGSLASGASTSVQACVDSGITATMAAGLYSERLHFTDSATGVVEVRRLDLNLKTLPHPNYVQIMCDDFTDADRVGWFEVDDGTSTLSVNPSSPIVGGGNSLAFDTTALSMQTFATHFPPVTLAKSGDSVTLEFKARRTGANYQDRGFRFGIYQSGAQQFTADADQDYAVNSQEDAGYFAVLDSGSATSTESAALRRDISEPSGTNDRLFGGTTLASDNNGAGADPLMFSPDKDFTYVLSITRDGNSLKLLLNNDETLAAGSGSLAFTESVPTTYTFDTLYFGQRASTAGATNFVIDDVCVSKIIDPGTVPVPITEQFTGSNPPDVANQTTTFIPNGSSGYYRACKLLTTTFLTDPAGGTAVTLTGNGSSAVNLSATHVSLYGTTYSTVFINANGNLTFHAADWTFAETLDIHFNQPRISGWFHDLDPTLGGTVSYRILADRVAFTYANISVAGLPANKVNFQIEMFTNGTGIIRITHLSTQASGGIVGLSSGPGAVPAGYSPTNLSALPHCVMNDWRLLTFGPGAPAGSGDLDDPDLDGIPNLLEYALGKDPKVQNGEGAGLAIGSATLSSVDYLTFSFDRPLNVTDVTYTIQSSPDLINWTPFPPAFINTTGLTETRQILVDPSGQPRLFFRVRITPF